MKKIWNYVSLILNEHFFFLAALLAFSFESYAVAGILIVGAFYFKLDRIRELLAEAPVIEFSTMELSSKGEES